jgi:prophage regulatory protein
MTAQTLLNSPEQDHQVPGDEFWSLKVVRMKTGLSRSTIYAYVATGAFPMQRRLGPRRIAWLASEVNAWIVSRPRP